MRRTQSLGNLVESINGIQRYLQERCQLQQTQVSMAKANDCVPYNQLCGLISRLLALKRPMDLFF